MGHQFAGHGRGFLPGGRGDGGQVLGAGLGAGPGAAAPSGGALGALSGHGGPGPGHGHSRRAGPGGGALQRPPGRVRRPGTVAVAAAAGPGGAAAGRCQSAEPNLIFSGLSHGPEPNDPEFYRQRWHMEMARVPAAWAAGHGRGDGVIVAGPDGGFQMDHPDFDPARWYKPYDAFRLREGPPVDDGPPPAAAHGSLVTGIIGAETNNGIGVAGIASRVQLMPVKVLRWQSGVYEGTLETVATGVRWAVDNGAHIISMSLGLEAHRAGGAAATSLAGELERAYRRGVLVIAAAGNGWSTA